MRRTLIILSALLLISCGTPRHITNSEAKDSTRLEVRTEYVERIDTIYIAIPRQAENIVIQDTVSHLENDFAVSDAKVDARGLLHHSLETKARSLPVSVKSVSERKDSIIFRDKEVLVNRPVYVEKKLTGWQTFRIKSWWAMVLLLVFAYRKEILVVIRKFV